MSVGGEVPSVQDERPRVPLPVDRVGFTGIRVPAGRLRAGGLELTLVPEFSVFIDLPPQMRGIHASRSYQSILKVVEEYSGREMKLEEIAAKVSNRLLEVHQYSRRSYVKVKTPAFHFSKAPISRSPSYEPFTIIARASSRRLDSRILTRVMVGVEAWGLTACPCAKEVVEKVYGEPATHMQRSLGGLMIEVGGLEVNVLELLEVLKSSMSGPVIPHLKRLDEADLVINAFKTPKFAEDCVRDMVKLTLERWSLPDNYLIVAWIRSEESLHHQDLAAYIKIKAGEARKILRDADVG